MTSNLHIKLYYPNYWKFKVVFSFLLCSVISNVFGQESLQGTITDANGDPVPGATIQIKGTTQGVVADFDGNFSLANLKQGDVLSISFIGMTTIEVVFEGQEDLKITLQEDSQKLSEVIVTGYEDISKKLFTGSAKKIDVDQEKIDGSRDISRLLEGKDAGVIVQNVSGSFGASPQIIIRGNTSINGNNNPLWVIDGVVLEDYVPISNQDLSSGDVSSIIGASIAGLNQEDISSLEILKDASATALYGARAKNGVVVITTKKGQFGSLQVNYKSSQTIRIIPNYNQFDLLNSQEEISVYKELVEKGIISITTPGSAANFGVLGKMYHLIANKELPWQEDFNLNDTFLKRYQLANTNWFKTLFKRKSVLQQHNVSLRGGSENVNYYFSLSTLLDPGQTLADEVKRYTTKLNATFKLSEKATLITQLNASTRNQKVAGTNDRDLNPINGEFSREFDINPYSYALNSARSITPFDENGKREFFRRNYTNFNILEEFERNYIKIDITDIAFQTDLKWQLFNTLTLNSTFNYRRANTQRNHIIEDDSNQANAYRAADTQLIRNSNPFLYRDPDKPGQQPYSILPEGGLNLYDQNTLDYFYIRNSLNWKKTLAENHQLSFLLGQEIKVSKRQSRSFDGYGFSYDKGYLTNTHPDAIKQVVQNGGQYFNLSNFKEIFSGSFAKASYAFKQKYLINLTGRYDGSNLLGKTRLARYLPTWNISFGWNIHQENALQNSSTFTLLKLKSTYGLTGGRGPLTSAALNLSGNVPLRSDDRESLIQINDLQNNDLTFEKLKEFSVGLEFGLFDNRVNGEIGYYSRNAYDLIGVVQTSGVGGIAFKLGNYAEMKVKGYEFALSSTNISTSEFKWRTSFNVGISNEKITDLRLNPRYVDLLSSTGAPIVNKPINALYAIRFHQLNEDGVPQFKLKDGTTTTDINLQDRNEVDKHLQYQGNAMPNGVAGFSTGFTFKNISLNANFSSKFGYKIRVNNNYQPQYNDFNSLPGNLKNRWTLPGDENSTSIPAILDRRTLQKYDRKIYALYNLSDLFIADGTYVRLRSVALNFDVQKPLLEYLKIQKALISITGENLWLLYADKKLKGQDPEFLSSGGVSLPLAKVVTLSLNLSL